MKINKVLQKTFLSVFTLVMFGSANSAEANIITKDSGVDVVTKRFIIDAGVSTATHKPGGEITSLYSNLAPPQAQTFPISGQFDVNFSRYWWSTTTKYTNDIEAVQSPPVIIDGISLIIPTVGLPTSTSTYEENWLTFSNIQIEGALLTEKIRFPGFARVNGAELSGDGGHCSGPIAPGEYCSYSGNGLYDYLFPSLQQGRLENGKINLQGWSHVINGAPYEGFNYNIQATVVPLPAGIWLFVSGLGMIAITRNKKAKN